MSLQHWQPGWRDHQIDELAKENSEFDLVVVGGGITGAGIYREACARGYRTLLVEQQDFAWGTSSRSSKMVHGGLRYLGKGQFGLARDSVQERQKLMDQLSGLVDPLPFLMGHYKGGFPGPWIFDKLLAIYDFFAGKRYRRFISSHVQDFWAPGLKRENMIGATGFMDAVTDDARLVIRTLEDGNGSGGVALNYVKAIGLVRADSAPNDSGRVVGAFLRDEESGREFAVSASAVINATGAWTDSLRQMLGAKKQIRPLRGSHLVLPFWRLPVSFAISFFHPADKRPVFVFPWEGQTVIGTTDLDHSESLDHEAAIHSEEIDYLLDAVNQQFDQAHIRPSDVISSWSGVRPVVVDAFDEAEAAQTKPSDEKREHMVWDDQGCISIAGGKLTTFRLLALEVLTAASPYLKADAKTFAQAVDFGECEDLAMPVGVLSRQAQGRLIGRYGNNAQRLLSTASSEDLETLGQTETLLAELFWACRSESVVHLDDLLLRRTRIGMLQREGALPLVKLHAGRLQSDLGWNDTKWAEELTRYETIIKTYYGLPASRAASGFSS